uniref:CHK domain-containing protein n=1 Tax=Caenorhabditis japonica TaxID=281687 RepID=A0A1D5RMZ5_CAEJA
MHITELVARQLGLTEVRELEPYATINGVTVVDLESQEGHFRVHLVRDSQSVNVSLEEGSKLSAYYNSLFWHEATTTEKIALPSGRFKTTFRVSDGPVKHSVFITTLDRPGTVRKRKLTLDELEQIAREIAKMHAVGLKVLRKEFETSVRENYENIRKYRDKVQKEVIEVLELAVTNELSTFFKNPAAILQKVGILTHHLDGRKEEKHEEVEEVIAHGRLTADTCRFDEHGNLVEITEWENIHLGNPVEDLTNLIISSADSDIRSKKFRKIFQTYFYALVDIHPPNYQLPDLKQWFREQMARAVVDGIEFLLLELSDGADHVQEKRDAAHRWESALDEAVDHLTGNYVSDDEQDYRTD